MAILFENFDQPSLICRHVLSHRTGMLLMQKPRYQPNQSIVHKFEWQFSVTGNGQASNAMLETSPTIEVADPIIRFRRSNSCP